MVLDTFQVVLGVLSKPFKGSLIQQPWKMGADAHALAIQMSLEEGCYYQLQIQ